MSYDIATEYLQNVAVLADLRLDIADTLPKSMVDVESKTARNKALQTINGVMAETNHAVTEEIVRTFGGEGFEVTRQLEPADLETFVSALIVFTTMVDTAPLDLITARKLQSDQLRNNFQSFDRTTKVAKIMLDQSASATAGNTEFAQVGMGKGNFLLMNLRGAPTIKIQQPPKVQHPDGINRLRIEPNVNFSHSRGRFSAKMFDSLNVDPAERKPVEMPRLLLSSYENVTEKLRAESEQAYTHMLSGEPISKDEAVLSIIYKTSYLGDKNAKQGATVQLQRYSFREGVVTLALSEYAEQNGISITYLQPQSK